MSNFKHASDTFQLGDMTIGAEAVELVKQQWEELARTAFQIQGVRTFDEPKSSAVVHEAGHAVLFASYGVPMRSVRVWPHKKGITRGHWVGRAQPTEFKWRVGPDASPEVNFKHACIQIAGRIAEELFDTENLRLGSSLEEIIQVRIIAGSIAQKTQENPNRVLQAIVTETRSILKSNESVVREIASRLDRDQVVRRDALGAMLARVQRPSVTQIPDCVRATVPPADQRRHSSATCARDAPEQMAIGELPL